MRLAEYLNTKGVWVDGLCWPSFSQSGGEISDVDIDLENNPIKIYVQEQYGRFGNNVHQLLNALVVARHLSVKMISCNFHLDEVKTEFIVMDDIEVRFGVKETPKSPVVSATMFYLQGFEKFICSFNCNRVKLDAERLFRLLFQEKKSKPRDWNKKRIAFHFRSGDIFSTNINPIYTQPPLSYYTTAFEHICETLPNREIHVVYEDNRNPCIEKFQSFLGEKGVPYESHSSSFIDDVRLIASVDCIVSSYSSFCDVLALMNENLGRWYAFRSISAYEGVELSISSKFANILGSAGTEVYRVTDDNKSYIALGDWKLSPEQVDQLLNYPASCLSIKRENVLPSSPLVKGEII
ncbi:hypothetical protein MMSR116_04495 [Methylobacterium mesophilicum SR1.6/6]|uniref:Uncharacterized protein n=1 Tax=Methylobacterium mesophilicum SR1.6/6 TaxID=908290 RepID=A0A6B9FD65_9HYPH|nr:hypothetical protein [Methylobacterium mesophilicum]QGY01243.1 hypothetical protein MMSR116_04495 [Methylobacterium mesophilicum SR1.6/6]